MWGELYVVSAGGPEKGGVGVEEQKHNFYLHSPGESLFMWGIVFCLFGTNDTKRAATNLFRSISFKQDLCKEAEEFSYSARSYKGLMKQEWKVV